MARYASLDPEKHDRICSAAIELFYRNGIGNTSIAQIAAQAGIAKGTVYLYFDSREQLEKSVFEHCFQKNLHFSMQGVEEQQSYREKLHRRVKNIVLFSRGYPQESHVICSYYKPINVVGSTETPFQQTYHINSEYIRLGMACGEFKQLPLPLITQMFFSGVEGLCTYFLNKPLPLAEDAEINQGIDTLLDMLAHRPST